MFGSVDEWFYRSLIGINPAAPGFEKIIIKPQPAGDLTWVKGSYTSVRGKIISEWQQQANTFSLRVSIPPNCAAEIWIPSEPNSEITENGRKWSDLTYQGQYAVIKIGSGNYSFKSTR
jgi:alpha-L-rhamnosidase